MDGVDRGVVVAGGVIRDLAVSVVSECIGYIAEGGPGQEAVLLVVAQRESAGAGQEAVAVVLVGDGVGAVERLRREAEVIVICEADAAGDGPRLGGAGVQRSVVAEGQSPTIQGEDCS